MGIAHPMTAITVGGEFAVIDGGDVTGMTFEAGMSPDQRPAAVTGVIECHRLPFLRVVAVSAIGSEAAGMDILSLMAAGTGLRQLVLQISGTMAILAFQIRMRALQCEPGLPRVIEAG